MAIIGKKGGQKRPITQKHTPRTNIGFQSVYFGVVWAPLARVSTSEFCLLPWPFRDLSGFLALFAGKKAKKDIKNQALGERGPILCAAL